MRTKFPLTQKILELLSDFHLLSAAEILALLKKDGLRYNKTSVYRALEALLAEQKICKQLLQDLEAKYELHDNDHAHFICRRCGKVSAFEQAVEFLKQKDFEVDHFHLTAFGLCKKCH